MSNKLERLIERIKSVLSADLILAKDRKRFVDSGQPLAGYCYIASEALYHLWGKARGFHPYRVVVEDPVLGTLAHWYLRKDAVILDITADQFVWFVPYDKGVKRPFLTKKPSQRTGIVIRRLKGILMATNSSAKKAWNTRKKNAQAISRRQRAAAKKAWITRRRNGN